VKRTIAILILVWLAASALILRPTVRNLIRFGGSTVSSGAAPRAVIGGRNAFVTDYERRSMVEVSGLPAWRDFCIEIAWANGIGPEDDSPDANSRWLAEAIDAPFHLVFRRPDGTLSDPLRIDFRPVDGLQWNANGDAITTQLWNGTALGTTERYFGRRQWNARVVLSALTGPLLLIAAMTAALCIVAWIIISIHRGRCARPNICEACGYDLSGCTAAGCPECGAGRSGDAREGEKQSSADQ